MRAKTYHFTSKIQENIYYLLFAYNMFVYVTSVTKVVMSVTAHLIIF